MDITQAYSSFPTSAACVKHLERVRWNGKPTCPYCKQSKFSVLRDEKRYHCNGCNASFSVTVRTIFHKTHVDLQKWFVAISLMLTTRMDITIRELSQEISVNKNTAWLMMTRIRRAILTDGKFLRGIININESGGASKNRITLKGGVA